MSDFIRNLFSEYFRELEEELMALKDETIREEKIKTARNLLRMNLSHEQIAKATGMDLSDVEALAAVH